MERIILIAVLMAALASPAPFWTTAVYAAPGAADDNSSCVLPVCDVSGALRTLHDSTQDARYKFLTALHARWKKSQDPDVWANLRVFSSQASELLTQLQEEDWLIREAQSILTDSFVGLAKFMRPFRSESELGFYRALSSQESRFAVLSYWSLQISTLSELGALQELIRFAQDARKVSQAAEDEDYVLRQCDQILAAATERYVRLNPYYEGVYEIQMSCQADAASSVAASCEPVDLRLNRLTILQAGGNSGLTVAFADSTENLMGYSFEQATLKAGATEIAGISNGRQHPAEFVLTLDPSNGDVSGWIQSTRSAGIYRFSGRVLRSARVLSTVPTRAMDLVGSYHGTIGELQGGLRVRQFADGRWVASFIQANVTLNFQSSVLFPERGWAAFVSSQTRVFGKVFVENGQRSDGSGQLTGFYFNQYGQILDVQFMQD